jgi:hypothetical protein
MNKHLLQSLRQSFFKNSNKSKRSTRGQNYRRSLSMESLESRQLLSMTTLQNLSVSEHTGEKPQSKVFEYAGQWWTVMPNSTGTWVFRLDGTNWTPTQQITTKSSVHADVKLVGDLAHVLLYDGASSQLATLQYDAGPDNRFEPWSLRPQLVNINLSSGTETATLEVDSTGRMWIASDAGSNVEVRYSDGLYTSWSAPIVVESGIKSDDIAAIIAMPGNQIGVFWSNQNTKRFGFKVHQDGAAANAWSSLETPAMQWVTSVGGAFADDHINLAVTSDGTLYAAVKTSYDSSSRPEIMLLVRRPNGQWDNAYTVDSKGTRPIVVVNEAAGKLIVAYSPKDGGGTTIYRESPLGNISFGPVQTLISGSNNNVTSTKYTSSNEIVFLAGSSSTVRGVRFTFDTGVPQVVNLPPTVNAGPDRSTTLGSPVSLDGTVSDDGQPTPVSLTTLWTKISGPGTVTFGNANAVDTSANFSMVGTYVLRLTVNDGQYSRFDEVTITVNAAPAENSVPAVNAGPDRTAVVGTPLSLDATVTDDGQPTPVALATLWTRVSGPTGGVVTFGNSSAVDTTANFSLAGTYVLRLTANDGELSASDDITVIVSEPSEPETPPPGPTEIAFQDGLFPYVTYAGTSDTKIAGSKATTNYGTATAFDVDTNIAALLRWDVSAIRVGSVVTSVTIELYVTNSTKHNYEVYALQRAWNELSATWQQFAAGQNWSTAGATGSADRNSTVLGQLGPVGSGTVQVQLNAAGIAAVQSWIDDPSANFGIIIQDYSASDGVDFYSSEHSNASRRPKLVINYEPAGGGSEAVAAEESNDSQQTPIVNLPPEVSAGPDRSTIQGTTVSLDGTVTDDDLPTAVSLTNLWTKLTGPGTVVFADASSADTTADFSAPGTYTLRLTAADGEFSVSDDVTVTVSEPPSPPEADPPQNSDSSGSPTEITFQDGLFPYVTYAGTSDTKIASKNTNTNYGTAQTLDIDGSPDTAGLLQWDISAIPAGSIIVSAAIELNISNATSHNYEIYALQRAWDELSATWQQAAAGSNWAAPGATASGDHDSAVLGQLGPVSTGAQRIELNDAGIAAVQAWIDDPSSNFGIILQAYAASNGVDFRSSETSNASQRPKLIINYEPAPAIGAAFAAFGNMPPVVNAGADFTVARNQVVQLAGTVTDDGNPSGLALLTVLWSKRSGPGAATFGDESSEDSTVQFSEAGTYTLRLLADDGELSAFDELTVTVV